jgi:membrane associated rhomboid family serine protease
MVYGLFGFVFFSGLFRGDVRSIGIALAVGFFYGGMVWGIMPNQPGISWESHLLGGLLGASLAYIYRHVNREQPPQWMEEPEPRKSFQDFIDKYGE